MKSKKLIFLTVLTLMFIIMGCSVSNLSIETANVGEVQNESRTIEREDASDADVAEVRVDIKMGAGELNIDGGAASLLEADFTYNVAEWEPQIKYNVEDERGRLTIRQPNTDQLSLRGDIRYEWDLAFDEDIPLDIRIEYGAGSGDLNLGDLNVTQLDVKLGAGDMNVDLNGNASLTRLELDMGAGDLTVDLTGDWTEDVDVDLQGGLGKTTLLLPEDIGVRVNVTKAIGDVDASGLYDRGDYYANKAYGDGDSGAGDGGAGDGPTIEISIQAGVGQIDLEIVE